MHAYLEEYHRSTAFHCKVIRGSHCYTQNISTYEKHLMYSCTHANEITGAVKSIVNPHLVIRKNETTYGKQK